MTRAGTPSASSNGRATGRAWVVPESLRPTLAERYGPVYSGEQADRRIVALKVFGACGDRVVARALELGHPPLIGIVDYKSRRDEPVPRDAYRALGARRTMRVANPPGQLTEALRAAVRELVTAGGGLLEVDGEEDLGALALVETLPLGATVIYGIPGEGVSFVLVDDAAKAHVRDLVAQMELRRPGHGD
jgi:GTP-dependent dephospho-CoA kinase